METRWSLRQKLIETFMLMCSLDTVIISLMLSSVLPTELAQVNKTKINLNKFKASCKRLALGSRENSVSPKLFNNCYSTQPELLQNSFGTTAKTTLK